ncbi:MAG: hypothetical protein J6X69_01470 [Bacteroidales bacterium]|nr:hypothetical protein [Bacteroidales bacterium]
MMEAYFSFSRFGSVLKTDLQNAWKNMGISFFLMSGSGALTYLFVLGLRWLAQWNELTLGGDARSFIFGVMMATLCIVTPSRCYGSVTELRAGRFFLLLPASVWEKSLSMILICSLILPVSACLVYFGLDSLLCRIDPSCGTPLLKLMGDEIWGIMSVIPYSLAFLLGAIFFKKSKIAKTIGCILLFYMVGGLLAGSFLGSIAITQVTPSSFSIELSWGNGFMTLLLVALIVRRVRTLQH